MNDDVKLMTKVSLLSRLSHVLILVHSFYWIMGGKESKGESFKVLSHQHKVLAKVTYTLRIWRHIYSGRNSKRNFFFVFSLMLPHILLNQFSTPCSNGSDYSCTFTYAIPSTPSFSPAFPFSPLRLNPSLGNTTSRHLIKLLVLPPATSYRRNTYSASVFLVTIPAIHSMSGRLTRTRRTEFMPFQHSFRHQIFTLFLKLHRMHKRWLRK